jgi:predicted dehydrogenase
LEFHGDVGSLFLGSFQDFHAPVEYSVFRGAYEPVPYVREPFQGIEWGRCVVEIAEAMEENRPQRATGAQAAHVVEILCAIQQSYTEGRPVDVTSSFPPPWPMEWSEQSAVQ